MFGECVGANLTHSIWEVTPTPYTLHPTPYTLHPAPYILHHTPGTLHPTPHTLHPALYTLRPATYNSKKCPMCVGANLTHSIWDVFFCFITLEPELSDTKF